MISILLAATAGSQEAPVAVAGTFYINCSNSASGDGSRTHPWNTLEAAQAHHFFPGEVIALARGSECHGTFSPQGSGVKGRPIRVTAYGEGRRPRIIASGDVPHALLLFNQEYWQIDSLDLSGANKYGVYISGDKGPLHHIHLKNLYVHDVYGGALKDKDNGLVIIGRSSETAFFDDVLVDGVDAAHTNQWAGILLGAGNYGNGPNPVLNQHVVVRNSTVHDVYGDGIILFRDLDSAVRTSAAWQIGMQPTQDIGTPNAIWTWTCTNCTVEDNEAYLTDSPGVDGGAYDIDWHNARNTVQRNYAHDTQGYCVAVFAAGFTTSESVVRDNVCIENGLSPRLAVLQGAVYLHTWNDGPIRGLALDDNTIEWNPPVPDAPAIVSDALVTGERIMFRRNHVISCSRRIYRSNGQFAPSGNTYVLAGAPLFTLGDRRDVTLGDLQAAGLERGSVESRPCPGMHSAGPLLLETRLTPAFDGDGLLVPEIRAQLVVLRSLAGQYGPEQLEVKVHLMGKAEPVMEGNALRDLEDVYPGVLHFVHEPSTANADGAILLRSADGRWVQEWHGFQNAATLGSAVRARLGAPRYAHMQKPESSEENK